jgi:hypothetical protein
MAAKEELKSRAGTVETADATVRNLRTVLEGEQARTAELDLKLSAAEAQLEKLSMGQTNGSSKADQLANALQEERRRVDSLDHELNAAQAELKRAELDLRKRQDQAGELARARDELAALQMQTNTSQSDPQQANFERERARGLAEQLAVESEKAADADARARDAQLTSTRASAAVTEAQRALEQERERGDALVREVAALKSEVMRLTTEAQPVSAASPLATPPLAASASAPPPAVPTVPTPPDFTAAGRSQAPVTAPSRLVARAEQLMQAQDIRGARLLLERALKDGDPHAALRLGETYDPTLLAPSLRQYADRARARELYSRAQAAGIDAAAARLNSVND